MKFLHFLILFTISQNFNASCQNGFPTNIYLTTEIPSKFFLGDDSIVNYIKGKYNICKYSEKLETIVLKFIVEPDGSSSNITFITQHEKQIENQIISMFSNFPIWIPGIENGENVRSIRMLLIKCENFEVLLPPYDTPIFKKMD